MGMREVGVGSHLFGFGVPGGRGSVRASAMGRVLLVERGLTLGGRLGCSGGCRPYFVESKLEGYCSGVFSKLGSR